MKASNGTKARGRLARERKIAKAICNAKIISGQRGKGAKSGAKRRNSRTTPQPRSLARLEAEVRRLATLSPLEYEARREAAAKQLGVRVAILDHEVQSARSALNATSEPAFLAETEPYPEPVDGGELLHDIAGLVQRFVVLDENEAIAVSLWVALAHAHAAATHSPILALESPEKRCGKSTLLSVLASLVPKPLPFANITIAALFRTIDKYGPTLLVDEADTFTKNSDELRGVLNSGTFALWRWSCAPWERITSLSPSARGHRRSSP